MGPLEFDRYGRLLLKNDESNATEEENHRKDDNLHPREGLRACVAVIPAILEIGKVGKDKDGDGETVKIEVQFMIRRPR